MYMVHIAIIFIFAVIFILSHRCRIPGELKKDEAYLQPFYRMASFIRSLLPGSSLHSDREEIRKELMMLNPAGDSGRLYRTFDLRRLGKSLMLIFGGNLIALFVCLISLTSSPLYGENSVERNDYGSGEKNVTLDIYSDGQLVLEGEDIEIGERQYSREEAQEMFSRMCKELEAIVPGDNESLDHVSTDLSFPASLEGYPVSIEWQLKNYRVMDGDGHLKAGELGEEGTLQEITAILRYHDISAEHTFCAMLYPPEETKELAERVRDEIRTLDKETIGEEQSILPMEVDGHTITYRPHASGDSLTILILIAVLSVCLIPMAKGDLDRSLKARNTQMMIDYPQIVSKLTLLIGAGMTIQGAFGKLAGDYEKGREKKGRRFAYEEMLLTVREMNSGVSEQDAYVRFGNRCGLRKYIKLGATLAQNLKRGGAGLLEILENEERDAFEERKALARRLGEEAGTKLLLPMGIMLIIVMVIVVVPAFLSFSL